MRLAVRAERLSARRATWYASAPMRENAVEEVEPAQVQMDRIARAVGGVPRVAYEAAHVYPLSTPSFTPCEDATRHIAGGDPIKLYVHVPFCHYACNFCFYAKLVGSSRHRMSRYVAAVLRELEIVENVDSLAQLYVGGGTPTALPADLLGELLAGIAARLRPSPRASVTVETSPESLTDAHLDALLRFGVGRASIGVQTLDEDVLETIQRRHNARQALAACTQLVERGFFVNVDLMYGFAGQTEASFRADLGALAACRPDSFTIYNVRLNERTPLARIGGDGARLDLATLIRWRRTVVDTARQLGYSQTRWHTFVRAGARTSTYDRAPCVDGFGHGRQLGVGVSAVSHLGDVVYRNEEHLESYLARIEGERTPVTGLFPLDQDDARTLFVVRTLGDGEPLPLASYEQIFGASIRSHFGDVIAALSHARLLSDDGEQLSLTDIGRLVYDLVTFQFYPERQRRWLAERQRRSGARSAEGDAPAIHSNAIAAAR